MNDPSTGVQAPWQPGPPGDPPNNPAGFASLLFLDVDGVLNSHAYCREAASNLIDRDKVEHLNRILATTGAGLVISSAWRYLVYRGDMTMAGLDWLLRSHGVRAGHLCGITEPDEATSRRPSGGPSGEPVPLAGMLRDRALQVLGWLGEHPSGEVARPYVVIDDLDLGFTDRAMPFVQTVGDVGMTVADADRAINLLGCKP